MYKIYAFDGLEFDGYLIPGDEQDMGTGAALTQFMPLPGGGFYDMYRAKRSPQGIRPITKGYNLWGETQGELREKLDAIRSKLGVRGKLTILYDDGAFRWQWARLQNVGAARPENAKSKFLPIEITWISAAQNWYGIIQNEGWTWGDESWTFGDGTAEFGQNNLTFGFTGADAQVQEIAHNGNIDVSNLRITLNGRSGAGNFTLRNQMTGQRIMWNSTFSATQRLVIDTGSRSVFRYVDNETRAMTLIIKRTNEILVTATAHGASVGQWWAIENTQGFNGIYQVATLYGANQLGLRIDPEDYDTGQELSGDLIQVIDEYANCTILDTKRWITLKPGTNRIQFDFDDYAANMTYTLAFYDHWA